MITNHRLRKIRLIVKSDNIDPVYGVTLPSYISKKWEGVFVRVIEDGDRIILQSGALPFLFTKTEIRNDGKKLEMVKI